MNKEQEILDIVRFLRDNAATKDELFALEQRMDQKLDQKINGAIYSLRAELGSQIDEVKNHIDGFIQLHQKTEVEMAAFKILYDTHEKKFEKISKHLNIEL